MAATLRGQRGAMCLLAREPALDVADGIYTPNVIQHLPGLANESADALSRKWQPGKTFTPPRLLCAATEKHPDARSRGWWRTESAPSEHSGPERDSASRIFGVTNVPSRALTIGAVDAANSH